MGIGDLFIGLFFTANVLFCAAYVVRDMVYLRTITIVAALCTFPYYYFQESPLYPALFWQAAFIVINGINLTALMMRRRPIELSELEQKLHILVFSVMSPRDMLTLLKSARWSRAKPGEKIITQGEYVNWLSVICDGVAAVSVDDDVKAHLQEGDFLGEMSFITGKSTSATVEATTDLTYLVWDRKSLDELYLKSPEMKDTMQAVVGRNMAEKLSRSHHN